MKIILFNKPYKVLCQFTDKLNPSKYDDKNTVGRMNLSDFIHHKGFYPAGRLDYHSEGLILLTDNGALQNRVTSPSNKMEKSYFVQAEGIANKDEISLLKNGVTLKDGITLPTKITNLTVKPNIWERQEKVAEFRAEKSQWYKVTLREGKNRQIRRMFAKINHPVLRLVRYRIGPWQLKNLLPGEYEILNINLPKSFDKK